MVSITDTNYKLIVRSPLGAKVDEIQSDFDWLVYTRRVNDAGILQFGVNGESAHVGLLSDLSQVQVQRQPDGVAAYIDFETYYEDPEYRGYDPSAFIARCTGINGVLGWPVINWYAGYVDRSKFTAVATETIMKTLVKYNLTSFASTGNGREITFPVTSPPVSGLSIEADQARGTAADWYCAWQNLLISLQELSAARGGDFGLMRDGAAGWIFTFYPVSLGADLRNVVTFGVHNGSMANPLYYRRRSSEKTVAVIGGPGEGSTREITTETGTNYSASNHREFFVKADDLKTASAREDRATERLVALRAGESLTFEIRQVEGLRYGVDYDLGDLVSAINPYTQVKTVYQIDEVTVTKTKNVPETVIVGLEEWV